MKFACITTDFINIQIIDRFSHTTDNTFRTIPIFLSQWI